MALQNVYNVFRNTELRARVRASALRAASAIVDEAGTTANHAQRLAWARLVFANVESEGDIIFSYLAGTADWATDSPVVSDATIASSVANAVLKLVG